MHVVRAKDCDGTVSLAEDCADEDDAVVTPSKLCSEGCADDSGGTGIVQTDLVLSQDFSDLKASG